MPIAFLIGDDSDEKIQIDAKFLKLSSVMKDALDVCDNGDDEIPIPFPNVNSWHLKKVAEYLTHYSDAEPPMKREELHEKLKKDGLQGFDAAFLDGLNRQETMDLACCGHYFNLDHLQLISSKKVADLTKGATRQDMREIFKLDDEWDPEQLKEATEEMEWLFGEKEDK